jgi:hypothetical protein
LDTDERRVEMGRIVVSEFVTLDGVIEAPGGGEDFEHAGWSFQFNRGEDGDKFKFDELMAAEEMALLPPRSASSTPHPSVQMAS